MQLDDCIMCFPSIRKKPPLTPHSTASHLLAGQASSRPKYRFVKLGVAAIGLTVTVFFSSVCAGEITLVEKGVGQAEIVLAKDASPSIRTAATELQRHLAKISGATLPIVHEPTLGQKKQIYVGESEFTKAKGFSLEDVKWDGFKIVAKDDYVILAGNQLYIEPIFGKWMADTRTADWQKLIGRKWRFPNSLVDFRGFNKNLGFYVFDGTGTLYSVYELLNQLGMRWYLPMVDLGIVYPSLSTVKIPNQDRKKEPAFPIRFIEPVNTKFPDEWLWYKSMMMGQAFMFPADHTLGHTLKFPEANPEEVYGKVNGKTDFSIPKMTSPKLRDDLTLFLETTLKEIPELKSIAITPPDGWGQMDEADAAAGWLRLERGRAGSFSDYTWDMIADVRGRLKKNYPDLQYIIYAYYNNKLPPTTIEKIPEDIIVVYCQNFMQSMMPESKDDLKIREEWLSKMSNDQMLVWEYYAEHAPTRNFPPIPVIFTKLMQENFKSMYGRVGLGTIVSGTWDYQSPTAVLRRPGLSHLMIYLHNRFQWDSHLDLQAVLDEYYETFFGPAKAEMKEFYEFAEKVWMRPGEREISANSGFLKPEDVGVYFDILGRAQAKAGADSIYRKRIDLIAEEMAPLKTLFENLQRKGTPMEGFKAKDEFVADGDLTKPFWTERPDSFVELRDMNTGEKPTHVSTSASVRWIPDSSKLVIGIECLEPKMDKLAGSKLPRDTRGIFRGDFVEVRLETPQGIRPHIAVNADGSILDESPTANAADLPHFYKVDDFAVKKYPDRWTAEIVIDAKTLGAGAEMPSKSSPWGIGINRQRSAGNTVEHYMLTPSGSDFQDPTNLGNLSIR